MSANDEAASSSKTSNAAAEGMYMDPRLYKAAVEGNIDPFKDITARELASIVGPNKNTILHSNIKSRNISSMETPTKFVEDILDRCPSLLLEVNVNDETPLHVAAKYGDSYMVKDLIKSSAKPQHEDLENGTGAAKQMLIRMTNNEGDTALHEAVRYKHLEVVKILTREDPDFSYSSNKRGETPLYIAAAKGYSKIVVEILETCTSTAYEGPDQMTALHAAALLYHPRITRKILVKNKSLIKERDQYGWTPLHYAAYLIRSESMEALLECDVSAACIGDKHRKMTPLHIAIGRGYIPNEIISRCPDCCELVDERRWNVLHFAMLSLSIKDLEILLKDRLKHSLIRNLINDKDVDGNTPLHLLATFRSNLLPKIKGMVGDIKLDIGVINNQYMSVRKVMMKSGSDQLKQEILKLEEPAGPYLDGVVRVKKESDGVVRVKKESDVSDKSDVSDQSDVSDESDESDEERKKQFEKAKVSQARSERSEERKKQFEKAKESHLIVAALIATVTFTAAFTLPGGVIQDGDKEGTAILSKKAAFQAFVITDAIAFVLSLSAVFAHFLMSLRISKENSGKFAFLLNYGAYSTVMAMVAMVIAFVTGTYAVLTTSLWLAILTTFIGLTFFILMFLILIGLLWAKKEWFGWD